MEFDYGATRASRAFLAQHPSVYAAFERVVRAGDRAFGRQHSPVNRLEYIAFGLGHACREDFMEISFLATNGYGSGATKLIRSLFERALTLSYLLMYPDVVDRFVWYAAIQEHRLLQAALKSGYTEEQWNEAAPENPVAEIRGRYRKHKGDYQITECKHCGTKRPAPAWGLDVAAMVDKVGAPFAALYPVGYAVPNLRIHATLNATVAAVDKNHEERTVRKRDEGVTALITATVLFVHTLRSQNSLFSLGLEPELARCDQDVIDVWG